MESPPVVRKRFFIVPFVKLFGPSCQVVPASTIRLGNELTKSIAMTVMMEMMVRNDCLPMFSRPRILSYGAIKSCSSGVVICRHPNALTRFPDSPAYRLFRFFMSIRAATPATTAVKIAGRHHGLPPVETPGSGLLIVRSTEAVSDERLAAKALASI